jgi:hypothetical protein
MGQRIHVETFDDTDPDKEATHNDEIWWEGELLEIDLCEENHRKLREFLEPFVKVARKKEKGSRPTKPAKTSPSLTAEGRRAAAERTEIRKWGRRNGWPDLGSIGKLPAAVIEAYHKYEGKDIPATERFEDPDPAPQ